MESNSAPRAVTLNNGVIMPLLGLGTFHLRGLDTITQALDAALRLGYRSFDTAAVYGNEADLGRALHQLLPLHGLTRSDVFITSKLAPSSLGEEAREACLRSLAELGCGYLDLYLIHWPGRQRWRSDDVRNAKAREDSWRAMEDLYQAGTLKSLGVSNYTERHLAQLLASCRVPPAVLQVRGGVLPEMSGQIRHSYASALGRSVRRLGVRREQSVSAGGSPGSHLECLSQRSPSETQRGSAFPSLRERPH
ncbi:hypothetical protein FKM82_022153 [Ascaphus truei]